MTINDIINILNNGKISPLCTECCPCGDIYVFASIETYLLFAEFTGWINYSKECSSGNAWQLSCCTENCLDKISSFAGKVVVDTILEKGYVEYSLLGGKSMLCTLYDYLVQNNLTGTAAATAIGNFLDAGVVYQCIKDEDITDGDNSKTIVASVETYFKYAEAENLFPPCENAPCQCLPEPCCFTVGGDVEAYLKYVEAVKSPNIPD